MRVLVTRPEPDGERTAAKLRARGAEVLLAPLLQIELFRDVALGNGPWVALAMTSANAVPAITQHPRRGELLALPAYVVGQRTAEAARAAGFSDVTSADGGRARQRAGACPLLPVATGGGAAGGGRRRQSAGRGAARRGRPDRAGDGVLTVNLPPWRVARFAKLAADLANRLWTQHDHGQPSSARLGRPPRPATAHDRAQRGRRMAQCDQLAAARFSLAVADCRRCRG